jgi:preprotein translocase subunit SecF
MNLPIIKNRRAWYALSALFIAVACYGVIAYGLNFGIDFKGGTLMSITWEESRPENAAVRALFASYDLNGVVIQPVGEQETILRFSLIDEGVHREISASLAELGEHREDRFETVGPSIGSELRRKSLWSIVLVILAVTSYVAWAFRTVAKPVASWTYGIIAIIVLAHDVFIPIGLYAFLGKFAGVEISSAFIVAVLTILGYSVNDTIVVLDRTRENLGRHGTTKSFADIVNTSVNETLSRSINTSLTTLLVLFPIVLFGGITIKYFALALMVGILAGTYSSLFLASPLLVTWYQWRNK